MTDRISFDGRVAIVTGAGRGLGRAYARELAHRGAAVVVNDNGVEPTSGRFRAELVAEQIARTGQAAVASTASVSTPDGGRSVYDAAVERFGRVDIVVNNAGFSSTVPFEAVTTEEMLRLYEIHVLGALYVTQPAFATMREQGYGRILLTIVDALRTPSGKGKPGGQLSGVHPADLLARVLRALTERTGVDPVLVDDVIGGCVGQAAEQALNITRSAVLGAGFPESVPATTIDRQCGSSQQAAHFAAQGVLAGAYDVVIACGVESMSRVPMGAATLGRDPMGPAVTGRYPDGLVSQGISAELITSRWKIGRDELDEYSVRSHARAAATAAAGGFDGEILPVNVNGPDGTEVTLTDDETIRPNTAVEGLAALKPSFRSDELATRFPEIGWQITAGNSSPLTDGASAVLIMSEEKAKSLGLRRARFHTFAVTGSDPLLMLTGVIPATQKLLARADIPIQQIDAYEVNEAFAPVPLAWQRELGADPERLNPRGGAIAPGHPLGASGTRLLGTLVNHLEATGGRYGLQTMCEGGGMANATLIERL